MVPLDQGVPHAADVVQVALDRSASHAVAGSQLGDAVGP